MTLTRWSNLDSRPFAAIAFLLIGSGMWLTTAVNSNPTFQSALRVPLNGYIYASYALAICATAWLVQYQRARGDRSDLERELRALRRQFLTVTDQAGVSVVSTDANGQIEEIFGPDLPEQTGCRVGDRIQTAFAADPQLMARLQNCLDQGGPCSGTILSAGRILNLDARPRHGADGDHDGLLIAVKDDTQRRADRASVARSAAELERSKAAEEFLRREAITPTAMFDREGRMIDANPAFCSRLGYGRDEVLRRSTEDLTHPEDIGRSMETMLALRAGPADHTHISKRYVRKDGSTLHAETYLAVRRDERGRVLNVLAQLADPEDRTPPQEDPIRRSHVGREHH